MQQTVDMGTQQEDSARPSAGHLAADELRRLAAPLEGSRVLHVNATPYGSGRDLAAAGRELVRKRFAPDLVTTADRLLTRPEQGVRAASSGTMTGRANATIPHRTHTASFTRPSEEPG